MTIISSTGVKYGDASASSYYTNILQDLFLPVMADAVIYPNTLLKRLPRSGRRIEGKLIKFPIHYDDANGVAAIAAGGLLPDADTEKFAGYAFGVRHLYVRLKFDGVTKDATKAKLASWLDVLMYEAEAKSKIMARARQRIYHNDGSGVLAVVGTVGTGAGNAYGDTTFTPTLNSQIESASTCTTSGMRWIKQGMLIAIVSVGGVLRAVAQVATVSSTQFTTTGTINIAGTCTLTDYIVTCSQISATSVLADTGYQNEPIGLAGILSDANPNDGTAVGFQGVDATSTSFGFARATVQANGGVLRPLTLDVLDLAWTTAIETGDTTPTVILGSFAGVRQYAKLLLADRRFVGQTDYDGGYKALDYNGIPYIADRDSYNNRAMFIDESDLTMNVMADPQWMNEDGSIYSRLEERDAYQATMYLRENLSSDMRKKHVLVTDLQE